MTFLKVMVFASATSVLMSTPALAKMTCKCPILKVEHAKELYGSGKTYDDYRGYIPHTERKVTEKARSRIARVTQTGATISSDHTCICQYSVRDSNDNEIDRLGLEELEHQSQTNSE